MSDIDDVARAGVKDLQLQIERLKKDITKIKNTIQSMVNRSIHLGPRRDPYDLSNR